MSPNLIHSHEKTLHWPEFIDLDSGHFVWLPDFVNSSGRKYRALLEDYYNEMAYLYIKDALTDEHIASYVLSFVLTPPAELGIRIPQVESAYVDVDYQLGGVSTAVYQTIIEYFGAVISDTHQTEAGMFLWLFGLLKNAMMQITVLTVCAGRLEFRLADNGEKIIYQADTQALLNATDTLWGNPDNLTLMSIEKLGIKLAWSDRSNQVLAATKNH